MNDGTLKVTPIESKMPQPAAKFTITATLDGFPFTVEAEGRADDLRTLVARLKAIGAEPPQHSNNALPSSPKPAGAPLCPTHNTPMAPSPARSALARTTASPASARLKTAARSTARRKDRRVCAPQRGDGAHPGTAADGEADNPAVPL
jgi:hypothetical protein